MPKAKSLSRPTYAEIAIDRLVNNYQYLKSITNHSFFCPMVKADAYGHDIELILPLLEGQGCKIIGVATIEEAIQVRALTKELDILVFSSDYRNSNDILHRYKLTPVLSDLRHLDRLENIKAHIKINTGMNRMGFKTSELEEVLDRCKDQNISIDGVLSHFYEGEKIFEVNSSAKRQEEEFKLACQKYFPNTDVKHIYNSDSLIASQGANGLGARPGIALYGYSEVKCDAIQPVMRLISKIVKIHHLKKGEIVSYGATWQAKQDTSVAVLPIGYADGLSRSYSNQYEFVCQGQKIKQIGTVCMDYTMVDISPLKHELSIYDPVVIYGNDKEQLRNIANGLNTITYELLTNISSRVPKMLVEKF